MKQAADRGGHPVAIPKEAAYDFLLNWEEFQMKIAITLLVSAFLTAVVASAFSVTAYAAARGAMSGKSDYATSGYKKLAKEKKMKH